MLWSRGGELISSQFPDLLEIGTDISNGTVIDGEILPYKNSKIGSFNDLQKRLGRKKVSTKIIRENPVVLKAYDLLEHNNNDIRYLSYIKRREYLSEIVNATNHP